MHMRRVVLGSALVNHHSLCALGKEQYMVLQGNKRIKRLDVAVRRLVSQTGISDDQARELIAIFGLYDWSSLLREAQILNRKQ